MFAVLAFVAAASMGADSDARDVAMSVLVENGASVTIAAPAYTRTVTASSYTLTGTSTGSGAVTWAASPSGSSGACTGTDSWSCAVTVTPDAVGEGVEVITVTRGAATDTETLGFYVAGAHSVFLSQNINGSYNVGLTNLDAVTTWENVGTSALDVTQATGSLKPTFRTGIVGGQPVVRCDGGDRVVAAAAADWVFLHDGTGQTTENVFSTTSVAGTFALNANFLSGAPGVSNNVSNDRLGFSLNNATTTIIGIASTAAITANTFNMFSTSVASASTPDTSCFVNGTSGGVSCATDPTGAYSSANGGLLNICSTTAGSFFLTGDLFAVRIYQSALTSTQRGINKAVDEWALGGTLPVTP